MSEESWKKDTEGVPEGVIPSAAVFLAAIREGPGWLDKEVQIESIAFLEKKAKETLDRIDAGWESAARRTSMFFWSGAFLGLRIAAHRYKQKLEAIAYEAGIDVKTGKKFGPS